MTYDPTREHLDKLLDSLTEDHGEEAVRAVRHNAEHLLNRMRQRDDFIGVHEGQWIEVMLNVLSLAGEKERRFDVACAIISVLTDAWIELRKSRDMLFELAKKGS